MSDPAKLLDALRKDLAREYEIEGFVGRGDVGLVFKAVEKNGRRTVALKVLPTDSPKGLGERVRKEARVAANLAHANIVPTYSSGTAAGTDYYTTKYVEGCSLDQVIRGRGALKLPHVLAVLRAIVAGLAYAHDRRINHRDVRGANVFIEPEGGIAMADPGILKAFEDKSMPDALIGSPQFMSPEQAAGQRVGPQADQYSIGVLAFQMLTGKLPFEADDPKELLELHKSAEPPDLAVARSDAPKELAELVKKALSKAPADRFATTRDMLRAVEAVPISDADLEAAQADLAEFARRAPRPKLVTQGHAEQEAERRKAEEGRLAEEKRQAEERKAAEEKRQAEERRKAEEKRLADERRAEEQRKAADAKRQAEEKRLADEKRQAEEKRLAEEKRQAEERQRAEEKRRAEERRVAEEKRLAEEKKQAEERRAADEKRRAEERRIADEKRLAEEKRAEEERQAAEERRAAEARRVAAERHAEEKRAYERRQEEERRQTEERAAERRRLEEKRAEEARIEAEAKRLVEERLEQERREVRKAEEKRLAEERAAERAAEEKRQAEVRRAALEKRAAETAAAEARRAEERAAAAKAAEVPAAPPKKKKKKKGQATPEAVPVLTPEPPAPAPPPPPSPPPKVVILPPLPPPIPETMVPAAEAPPRVFRSVGPPPKPVEKPPPPPKPKAEPTEEPLLFVHGTPSPDSPLISDQPADTPFTFVHGTPAPESMPPVSQAPPPPAPAPPAPPPRTPAPPLPPPAMPSPPPVRASAEYSPADLPPVRASRGSGSMRAPAEPPAAAPVFREPARPRRRLSIPVLPILGLLIGLAALGFGGVFVKEKLAERSRASALADSLRAAQLADSIRLASLPTTGWIVLEGDLPEDAILWLDTSQVHSRTFSASPGPHTVEVESSEFQAWERHIVVRLGDTLKIFVELELRPDSL